MDFFGENGIKVPSPVPTASVVHDALKKENDCSGGGVQEGSKKACLRDFSTYINYPACLSSFERRIFYFVTIRCPPAVIKYFMYIRG